MLSNPTPGGHSLGDQAAPLTGRPGKIIAVHLSFASRAEQRGRVPAAPSYFFKPSSSIAESDATIERPAGTELLAFEGEIALVIGTPAYAVTVDEAWDHVAAVTAANDFGLYDYRAPDKGSNVRAKGRDGYTPLGPAMMDARQVDPTRLRVRTWVNGRLAQEDTAAGMLFTMAQIVADISQHLTLETGDVILTGTPAGSSVVAPGDVVEVEVDDPATGLTSGRLRTTVIKGTVAFDPALGSLPAVTDEQRAAAWGSRAAAGLPDPVSVPTASVPTASVPTASVPTASVPTASVLTDELRDKLTRAPLASLSSQLRKRGLNAVSIDGVHPLPGAAKLVGAAKTLRFVPFREDLFKEFGGGYNAQKRAFDAVKPGEVLVIEARGDLGGGTLGDVLALRAKIRGAAGVVTDGPVRDLDVVTAIGLPVYAAGSHPAVLGRRHVPWDTDITIACGGATVQPGDIIVGDADGVLVIPPALAEEVADGALAQEESDAYIAARVAEGERLEGLFPMNDTWRAKYADHQTTHAPAPRPEGRHE